MIRIIFLFITIMHGLIHIMGFIKAFNLAEIDQLAQSISKPVGLIWLFASLLFLVTVVLFLLNKEWWWMLGIVAIIVSQGLIISCWQDAKYGTILNILVIIAIILGVGAWKFNRQVNKEINTIATQEKKVKKEVVVTEEMLDPLPQPVQKWLNNIGIIGKEKIHNAYFKQIGKMKLKPEQESWTEAEAKQYVTTDNPTFLWKVNMSMMPLVDVVGRDIFINGQGEMQIKIASLIPVVNVANNAKLNQAALQRYLAEMPWYPSAALSPFISWETVDEQSAKATMTYKGVSGSVIFHFNEQGDFRRITAQRYKDSDEKAELKEWIGEVKETSVVNGIKIPTKLDVSWVLGGEVFTWYKLEIFDIEYNKETFPKV